MNGIDGVSVWNRRDEFVRDGIPLDVYRRQIALAHQLRGEAYVRLFNTVSLVARSVFARAAHRPAVEPCS